MLLSLLAAWVSFAIALLCVRAAAGARRQARVAVARAAEALQQAADEELGRETALRLLDATDAARRAEAAQAAARLDALRVTYDQTIAEYRSLIAMYRTALGERPDDPPTTH